MTTTEKNTKTVHMERFFDSSPERLFEAWTKPEILIRWFGCKDTASVKAKIDLKVGGSFRFEMTGKDGQQHLIIGEYQEIVPASKLVFSMDFTGGCVEEGTTLVSLTFVGDERGKTCQTLIHEKLNDEMAESVDNGWGQSMEKLSKIV